MLLRVYACVYARTVHINTGLRMCNTALTDVRRNCPHFCFYQSTEVLWPEKHLWYKHTMNRSLHCTVCMCVNMKNVAYRLTVKCGGMFQAKETLVSNTAGEHRMSWPIVKLIQISHLHKIYCTVYYCVGIWFRGVQYRGSMVRHCC